MKRTLERELRDLKPLGRKVPAWDLIHAQSSCASDVGLVWSRRSTGLFRVMPTVRPFSLLGGDMEERTRDGPRSVLRKQCGHTRLETRTKESSKRASAEVLNLSA